MFRENQSLICVNVEYSPAAADEGGFTVESLFQLCRQTGGAGLVVSNTAVGDRDFHDSLRSPF
jgi:hypothetical protein